MRHLTNLLTTALLALLTAGALLTTSPLSHRTVTMHGPQHPIGHAIFQPVAQMAEPIFNGIADSYDIGQWHGHKDCVYFEWFVGHDSIGCPDGYGEVVIV